MTQEPIEQWRAEFESMFDDNLLSRGSSGEYLNDHRNSMWHGFCLAKRSQKVIELPKPDHYYGDSDHYEAQDVHVAITAAGYQFKVKE